PGSPDLCPYTPLSRPTIAASRRIQVGWVRGIWHPKALAPPQLGVGYTVNVIEVDHGIELAIHDGGRHVSERQRVTLADADMSPSSSKERASEVRIGLFDCRLHEGLDIGTEHGASEPFRLLHRELGLREQAVHWVLDKAFCHVGADGGCPHEKNAARDRRASEQFNGDMTAQRCANDGGFVHI